MPSKFFSLRTDRNGPFGQTELSDKDLVLTTGIFKFK